MNHLLLYAGQVILISGLLYGYYYFFLRNRQFHQYNRFYLLLALIASFIIPLCRFSFSFASQGEASPAVVKLLRTIYTTETSIADVAPVVVHNNAISSIHLPKVLLIIYIVICFALLLRTLISLVRIKKLATKYPAERSGEIRLMQTLEPGTPFSFFNWLFWNSNIPLDSAKGKQILRHELFHIRQKHSRDILFMQLLIIICWFNPFLYLIRKELRVIHEFLADAHASKEEGECAYAELLLMHALKMRQSFVNPFFQTQIKRRIAMITQTKTNNPRYVRRLLALPFAAILLALSAFRIHSATTPANEEITVVIDAGHGGFDPGAKSPDNKLTESSMTLALASTIQSLAPEYGIKAVMTRETGDAVGATKKEDLENRLSTSVTAKPSAFLSLHVNTSGKPGTFQETRSGFEAMIASKRNDQKGRILASAMLQKLSDIYPAVMEIKQRKDAGIYVLDKNDCPAVLLTCGYINNQKDVEFFTDKTNQEKIARVLLEVLKEQGK